MKGILKIGASFALMVASGVGMADPVDASLVASLWQNGDSALVCQVHENARLRNRCSEMAEGIERTKREAGEAGLMQQNPALGAAIYHPACQGYKGLQAEQCNIREALKLRERQPVTAARAAYIFDIIGRGQ